MNRKREITKKDKRKRKPAGQMKYADFFDPPGGESARNKRSENLSEDENEAEEEMEGGVEGEEDAEDDQVAASGSEDEMDSGEEESKGISNFEKKQQKVHFKETNNICGTS